MLLLRELLKLPLREEELLRDGAVTLRDEPMLRVGVDTLREGEVTLWEGVVTLRELLKLLGREVL